MWTTVSNEGTTNVHGRITTTNMHLIQLLHTVHGWSSRGYTFEACVFEVYRVGVEEVVEVVVHATVVEVVVLSFIGDHRSGSGSRGSQRLVENHDGGSRTRLRFTGLRRRSSYMVRNGTCIFGLDESEGFGVHR